MSAAVRCVHGALVAADGSACADCGPEAQRAAARCEPARGDGRQQRDRGMKAALDRPAAGWDAKVVDHVIRHLASSGKPFSVNDAKPLLPAVSGSIIGARFYAAARSGRIERIGDTHAAHAVGHRRRVGLWRTTASTQPSMVPPAREPDDERQAAEAVAGKAARLLAAGRVRVLEVRDGWVRATVAGDTGEHAVRRTPAGHWACSCSAGTHGRTCSHTSAVALVIA